MGVDFCLRTHSLLLDPQLRSTAAGVSSAGCACCKSLPSKHDSPLKALPPGTCPLYHSCQPRFHFIRCAAQVMAAAEGLIPAVPRQPAAHQHTHDGWHPVHSQAQLRCHFYQTLTPLQVVAAAVGHPPRRLVAPAHLPPRLGLPRWHPAPWQAGLEPRAPPRRLDQQGGWRRVWAGWEKAEWAGV